GTGAALPAPPAVTGASLAPGPAQPGNQQLGSPVCNATLLQLRFTAPSHEELWLDSLTVRAGGAADDVVDVDRVRLVRDANGNGVADGGEAELGAGTFASDNGAVTFPNLAFEVDPGATADLVVAYEITVQSVSSMGTPALWALPAALLWALLRPARRAAALALLLALVPVSCGGGGGGDCNAPFNAAGVVTTFTCRVQPGDLVAFTTTRDPTSPLPLPSTTISSGTLSVSN
ncbi:MAG: hypothetical protein ACREID_10235, partial [Planctomycetota bacterium]